MRMKKYKQFEKALNLLSKRAYKYGRTEKWSRLSAIVKLIERLRLIIKREPA